MTTISYEDFNTLDIRVGTILKVEEVPKSRNLLKMQVDIGEENPRQIVSGIKNWYSIEDLKGSKIIVLANLKPRKIMGIESKGMLLAADVDNTAVLLKIDENYVEKVNPGSKVG
ncbi:methionine--tRNA ligase subunit beta [Promethearchaeum syntrophicum]|uniref:Methionine--tRNA ligase n=1 Tax=Promethearchaeum syntrophicum TaxID=2594042 RepID=A0A5B9D8G9_9ARCH|nr:methionine--tRNA ligase subunit beta [Candidatus Prometheoarchaeum syntrophicum]